MCFLLSIPSVLKLLENNFELEELAKQKKNKDVFSMLLDIPVVFRRATSKPLQEVANGFDQLMTVIIPSTASTLLLNAKSELETLQQEIAKAKDSAAMGKIVLKQTDKIKRLLNNIDNCIEKTSSTSQILINILHWVGAVVSFGLYYQYRVTEMGKFTYHSRKIEDVVHSSLHLTLFAKSRKNSSQVDENITTEQLVSPFATQFN